MFKKIEQWLSSTLKSKVEDDDKRTTDLAAAMLMLEISRVDLKIVDSEKQIIVQNLVKQFELSDEEAVALLEHAMSEQDQQLSAHPLIKLINDEMDIEARRELMRGMWRVAYADLVLEKYEEYHLRKTADWLYLSHADFMKSKHAVMDELGIPHEV